MNDGLQDLLDVALEESFPASDPPFFMAGAAVIGRPSARHPEAVPPAPSASVGSTAGRTLKHANSRTRRKTAVPARHLTGPGQPAA